MHQYEMNDLGEIIIILVDEFSPSPQGLLLHKKSYITKRLKEFNMFDCKQSTLSINDEKYFTKDTNTPYINPTFTKD